MRKRLLENFGLKVTAVIMAIILWFFVISKGQSEISLDIPMEPQICRRALRVLSRE